MNEIDEEQRQIDEAYQSVSASDFLVFTRGLIIASQSGGKVFDEVIAPFQLDCFTELAPSIESLRLGRLPPRRRWWLERTKKASKDADLAIIVMWLLAFPTRPFYIQIAAADQDQAAIVKRRIEALLFHNDWLNERIKVQNNHIKSINGLAKCDIIAADVAGSHGETPDLLVVNELSHITKWEFVENLMDNASGVARGVVIIATNAGFKGTKAEVYRNIAKESKEWAVHIWDTPAPWHTQATIEEAKKRNIPSRYKRLWWGKWASGKGDAFDEQDIERVFRSGLKPLVGPEQGWRYVAGLDLGISHDHCGIVVVGVHEQHRIIRVAAMRAFEPPGEGREIELASVQEYCLAMAKTFRIEWFGYDPHQAVLMSQQLRKKNVPMQQVTFTAKNLQGMATALKMMIEDHLLECYEDDRLLNDFSKLNIVEKSYGIRLEAVSDETGHADVGTALAILAPRAISMLAGKVGLSTDDDVATEDWSELTEDEIKEMPAELKEICDVYDDIGRTSEKKVYAARKPKKVLIYDD